MSDVTKLKKISFKVENEYAYVGFGHNSTKSMTVLDRETLEELHQVVLELQELEKSKGAQGAIFFSHVPGCFLAGADIKMIQGLNTKDEGTEGAELGQKLFNAIEDLQIPTITLIDGVCLGGGLEFAMSTRKILVSKEKHTKLGLPEVKLGILPGFGGTYRLPKRVGLPKGLDMILSGKMIDGKRATKWKLAVDAIAAERMLDLAPRYLTGGTPKRKKNWSDSLECLASSNFVTRKLIFQKARESVMKITKGHYQGPLKILDHLEEAQGKNRKGYLKSEAEAFGELCVSEQSKNLQHIFFLMEGAKKYKDQKVDVKSVQGKRAAVLGAGVMGGGIAWLLANHGHHPVMKDITDEALELGFKQASENFHKALKRRKITKDELENRLRSIYPTKDNARMHKSNLVVEAIVENMQIKKQVLKELEDSVKEDCLITSNTSSLSIAEMGSDLKHPERFLGLHFFNPVHRMPLVEIITHDKADPEKVRELYAWALDMKKTPVVVKDGPGFLVNRILMPYLNESCYLLEEGIPIKTLDDAALNFGMPMGPCRLMDEVGLDVLVKVAKILHQGLGARAKPTPLAAQITDLKCLGRKNDRGFYLYNSKGKSTGINEEVYQVLPAADTDKEWDEREVQMRLFLPMINEAANILNEGLIDGPDHVDLGMIFGTGFPPFRGGLCRYADSEGLKPILEAIRGFAKKVNKDRYAPSPYLEKLVAKGVGFYGQPEES